MTFTSPELRALRAVERREVKRVYRSNGNVIRGASGLIIRRLEKQGLIREGKTAGDLERIKTFDLTAAGKAAIAEKGGRDA